jgi:hypothetical protein
MVERKLILTKIKGHKQRRNYVYKRGEERKEIKE